MHSGVTVTAVNNTQEPTATNGVPVEDADRGDAEEKWFGINLRAAREAAGLSQSDVARAMSDAGHAWYQTTTSRVEAGDRPVRLTEARQLAELVGVSLDDLVRPPRYIQLRRFVAETSARALEYVEQLEDATIELLTFQDALSSAREELRSRGGGFGGDAIDAAMARPEDIVRRARAIYDRETGREQKPNPLRDAAVLKLQELLRQHGWGDVDAAKVMQDPDVLLPLIINAGDLHPGTLATAMSRARKAAARKAKRKDG